MLQQQQPHFTQEVNEILSPLSASLPNLAGIRCKISAHIVVGLVEFCENRREGGRSFVTGINELNK